MTAFSRFNQVMAAISAMLASNTQSHMGRAEALDLVGGYKSRGKRSRKAGTGTGIAKVKRAVKKAANIQRHKNHCRG